MKPYLTFQSMRPGCYCCVSKDGHGAIPHKRVNATRSRVERTAKRGVRQALKQDLRRRINE